MPAIRDLHWRILPVGPYIVCLDNALIDVSTNHQTYQVFYEITHNWWNRICFYTPEKQWHAWSFVADVTVACCLISSIV
jgi:hypothetical protein